MKTIAERLKELNADLFEAGQGISKEMRMRLAINNGCSLATIDRYLKNKATYVGFAEKLLSDIKLLPKNVTAA